jgi:hypothetical protein
MLVEAPALERSRLGERRRTIPVKEKQRLLTAPPNVER